MAEKRELNAKKVELHYAGKAIKGAMAHARTCRVQLESVKRAAGLMSTTQSNHYSVSVQCDGVESTPSVRTRRTDNRCIEYG